MNKIELVLFGSIALLSAGIGFKTGYQMHENTVKPANLEDNLVTERNPNSPVFEFHGVKNVGFKDNLAPGMKAYVRYESRLTKLEAYYVNQERSEFRMPDEVFNGSENYFFIYAKDRDGNFSETKRLYVLDGVVIDSLSGS